jgi:hypothetical protein
MSGMILQESYAKSAASVPVLSGAPTSDDLSLYGLLGKLPKRLLPQPAMFNTATRGRLLQLQPLWRSANKFRRF